MCLQAKPMLCLHIERRASYFVWRVTLPVFIVVLLALSFEGIRGRELQDEYNAVFTSLLTMTAFSYSVQSSLPKLPYVRSRNTVPSRRRCRPQPPRGRYMTLADKYFLFGFVYHLIIVFKIVWTSAVCDEDTYSTDLVIGNSTFLLGDTTCELVDHFGIVFLWLCWLLPHILIVLDLRYPSLIADRLRLPYDQLAQDFAEVMASKAKNGTVSTPERRNKAEREGSASTPNVGRQKSLL